MKECGKYDYIIYSKEFKVFARGKGEIDKVLQSLPRQTPMQVLEKFRFNFSVDEEIGNDQKMMKVYKERIFLMQKFVKKALVMMEKAKNQLKKSMQVRDKQI